MGKNITTDMVASFQIHEDFMQCYPCSHTCKIVLINGRTVKKDIDGPEIYLLIQEIAKEKISFKRTKDEGLLSFGPQTLDHFNGYKNFPYSFYKPTLSKIPSANEILSLLFEEKDGTKKIPEN